MATALDVADEMIDLSQESDGEEVKEEHIDGETKGGQEGEDSEDMCCICLDNVELDTQGFLLKCVHTFHFDCILQWAKVTNLCPMCKTRFRKVVKRDANGNVTLSEDVRDTKQTYSSGSSQEISANVNLFNEYACSLCGNGDHEDMLLICDANNCDSACHTFCLGLADVPPSHWYCPDHVHLPPPSRRSALQTATTLASLRSSRRSRRSVRMPVRRITQLEARVGIRRGQRLPLPFENEVMRYESGTTAQSNRRGAREFQSAAARDLRRMQAEASRILQCVNGGQSRMSLISPEVRAATIPKRRIEEIQAIISSPPQSKRPAKKPASFRAEYDDLYHKMERAHVQDTSTLLPTASKLRLLPTVKRFFDGLNDAQKTQVLEWGWLRVLKQWLEPYGPAKLQHVQVMETVLTILDELPIEKEHLKESDGLGKVVTQLVRQLDMHSQAKATQLLTKWSAFVRASSVDSVNEEEETKRPAPTPVAAPAVAPRAPPPPAKRSSTPTHSAQHMKPLIVQHIKQQLYPAYHLGKLSKDKFTQVTKGVCQLFLDQLAVMSSAALTQEGELSEISKKRLNSLIDQATA
ncbi:hypothetical protein AC1031_018770 [Aphanomyces cochlioides]|nr:hypothetical protein AC1031_018770 [Aphanomyces cochlioides]